jgi:hypothetical protein
LLKVATPPKSSYSLWKRVFGACINIRGRLDKVNLSSLAEVLKQPIFRNIQILSFMGRSLKVGNRSDGRLLAIKGITKLKHLCDAKTKAWKTMSTFGFQKHL